jgi:hemerythrin
MLLHWSVVYETGHPEIDAQHKQIVDTMNKLHEAVAERKHAEVLADIMDFLEKYVRDHFSFEEKCMREFVCPRAKENKQAHAEFNKRVSEMKAAFDKASPDYPMMIDFYYEMVYWIKDHILEIDRDNFVCVSEQLKEKFKENPTG